ncbi:MAG: hypothetical protein FRX49_08176 [Trebouxia sp. A1-2]|nr:MAG: hypothetical protein FRX49_08176 [Trebouxia sp. A1-2]
MGCSIFLASNEENTSTLQLKPAAQTLTSSASCSREDEKVTCRAQSRSSLVWLADMQTRARADSRAVAGKPTMVMAMFCSNRIRDVEPPQDPKDLVNVPIMTSTSAGDTPKCSHTPPPLLPIAPMLWASSRKSQAGLHMMFDLVASHDACIPAAMRLLHMPQPYSLNTFLTRGVQYSSAAANPK